MFLELSIKLRMEIPESLNARLEEGEDQAFKNLEEGITVALERKGFKVKDVFIEDAGPHNVGEWTPRG